jgi:hypothetical protein
MSPIRGPIAAAVVVFALLVVVAPRSAAAAGEFDGDLPAGGGIALVVWTGGNTNEIVAAASAEGCVLDSVWSFVNGFPVGFIVGAPDFVNAPYLAIHDGNTVGAGPMLVVCQRSLVFQPGQDIAAIVAGQPAGTTFRFAPGVYRRVQITPKSGQTFIGEPGAILSGARVLEGFQADGNHWSIGGQTSQLFGGGPCDSFEGRSYNGCQHPEQLFLDGNILWQVERRDQLQSGRWYFDYGADRIYLADNPQGRVVELSVTENAFRGNAGDVTIRGLVVEKYANRAQTGAISADNTSNWLIEDVELRYNHGTGIRVGDGSVLRNSFVHHNGQLGVAGGGDGILVEGTEIANNNIAGFNSGWEGGGTKFFHTRDLVLRNNYVHHNDGRGLWTDINNIDSLIESNLVEHNSEPGIAHEISYAAVIRNNTVRHNGLGFDIWVWGAQILVQNSPDVVVTGNTVVVPATGGDGIAVVNQQRGSGNFGPWVARRVVVTGNDITYLGTEGWSGVADDTGGAPSCNASAENRFEGNTYRVGPGDNARHWYWCAELGWNGFNGAGADIDGTLIDG